MSDPEGTEPGAEPEDVAYDLADWNDDLRAELDEALAVQGVSAHWVGDDLVVADAHADLVEDLIDAIEDPDALPADDDEEEGDDGPDAAATLSSLFISSDVLLSDPRNSGAVVELLAAVEAASGIEEPYGLDEEAWIEVRAVAESLADLLGESADDDSVVEAARRLRDLVHPLV